jgi:hypothetical protein
MKKSGKRREREFVDVVTFLAYEKTDGKRVAGKDNSVHLVYARRVRNFFEFSTSSKVF